MCLTQKDYLDSTLSCSLGTGDYKGIFCKQLKRGTILPCTSKTITTTIYDNQTSLLIEIYQGERPLTRYCKLIGSLNVNDLPLDKAEKIIIEIEFSIDKNEILTVKAHELKTNKKLTVIIEHYSSSITNSNSYSNKLNNEDNYKIDNLVIEAIENKKQDNLLVNKLEEIDKLIELIRNKYNNDDSILNKMNDIIDNISKNELTIDLNECYTIINTLNKYL
jgi:molecular chaperone DnaK (HSP70)